MMKKLNLHVILINNLTSVKTYLHVHMNKNFYGIFQLIKKYITLQSKLNLIAVV